MRTTVCVVHISAAGQAISNTFVRTKGETTPATGEAFQTLALPQSVTILQPSSSWRLPAQSIIRVERRPNEAKPTQYGGLLRGSASENPGNQ
jgi:hypothetical protein